MSIINGYYNKMVTKHLTRYTDGYIMTLQFVVIKLNTCGAFY